MHHCSRMCLLIVDLKNALFERAATSKIRLWTARVCQEECMHTLETKTSAVCQQAVDGGSTPWDVPRPQGELDNSPTSYTILQEAWGSAIAWLSSSDLSYRGEPAPHAYVHGHEKNVKPIVKNESFSWVLPPPLPCPTRPAPPYSIKSRW